MMFEIAQNAVLRRSERFSEEIDIYRAVSSENRFKLVFGGVVWNVKL